MKPCMLCGTPTEGSVGAAGIKWTVVCQPCKDEEDGKALETARAKKVVKSMMDSMMDVFKQKG